MYKSLNGPAIGIKIPLPALIDLAKSTGFAGVDFDMREALALPDAKALFTTSGIRPAQWSLPVNGAQSEWAVDLDELAACARLAASLGAPRCATWVPSWSDSRDLATNTAHHIDRLTPVARVLADHGCSLGLEFLGPVTLFQGHAHAFIHTMPAMLDLGRKIGPNVGLLLDAWHLFTSGGTLADQARLRASDVVHVHINDAPKGVRFDQVIDTVRHLPLETGVLDLAGFIRTLADIGYDGPVTTEPFNARLNAIAATDPIAAAHEVSAAMDRLWQISGLA
jgi:sugar phosphate isomerase/epimerase